MVSCFTRRQWLVLQTIQLVVLKTIDFMYFASKLWLNILSGEYLSSLMWQSIHQPGFNNKEKYKECTNANDQGLAVHSSISSLRGFQIPFIALGVGEILNVCNFLFCSNSLELTDRASVIADAKASRPIVILSSIGLRSVYCHRAGLTLLLHERGR